MVERLKCCDWSQDKFIGVNLHFTEFTGTTLYAFIITSVKFHLK